MKKIWVVPTLLTLANGYFGILALAKAADAAMIGAGDPRFGETLEYAALCILFAMACDALDGWVARRLGTSSALGAQLDSLCDAITFGVAPAIVFKSLVEREAANRNGVSVAETRYYLAAAACYALCAILRLARFNVDSSLGREDHKVFRGLPSPGAAIVVASVVLFYFDERWTKWLSRGTADAILGVLRGAMPFAMVGLGFLMVSRIGYPHFATAILGRRRSFRSFAQLVVALALLWMEFRVALLVGSVAFAVYGPAVYLSKRARGRRGPRPSRALKT
ncbi:MAG TPA: CDP-alcohol phosphatidyltransferase family protein [Planctomycetota bacterium]|nr:CDP-alcohol phosphatidyltransferase family protein [Planctomycetota bacterium]